MTTLKKEQRMKQQFTDDEISNIAQVAHEANRAVCLTNGDFSQPEWKDAPNWQRDSAINGVKFHLENRYADPRDSHDNWMEQKLRDGWAYGPTKNVEAKLHPCLLPFRALPESEKIKDSVFRSIVIAFIERSDRLKMGLAANNAGLACEAPAPQAQQSITDAVPA